MENTEIARVFEEIAEMLEVKADNPFRIRSYRNAAQLIEGYPESLRSVFDAGGEPELEKIKGIGSGIGGKIVELLTTGTCAFHAELIGELSGGVLDMLRINGVGPKKAMLFKNELGISGVDELEAAAKEGRLRGLPGVGEKTEEKILKAITDLRVLSERFSLPVARAEALAYADYLSGVKGVSDVVPAGSLRRWRDSIGDIDILVTSKDPASVARAFTSYHDVDDIIESGETRSAVRLASGIRVDLRVVERDTLGAAMQYFTGSQAHNVAVRERAVSMGLKVSEYGVFRVKDNKRIAGKTEEEVYKVLGLPYIPPEMRENRGEIEAALAGTLPVPLEVGDIRGDLHMHTTESDGADTLEEMAGAAMERGYEYIAITDHSKAVSVARGLDERRVEAEIKEIDAFNARLKKKGKKLTVLKGTEVDIKGDGTLDHPERLLEKLDCVVAAVHSGFNMDGERMTARIVRAIESGLVDIIAHPTGRIVGARRAYEVDMERVIDAAHEHGVALELNSYPERLDLKDSHLRLARERGVMVAISTDSHSAAQLAHIEYGVHMARRGWLEKKDVLNTLGLKALLKRLKGRRA